MPFLEDMVWSARPHGSLDMRSHRLLHPAAPWGQGLLTDQPLVPALLGPAAAPPGLGSLQAFLPSAVAVRSPSREPTYPPSRRGSRGTPFVKLDVAVRRLCVTETGMEQAQTRERL